VTDALVTQLHPAPTPGKTPRRKSKDVTGPLRSRRARQKREAALKPANMPIAHPYENLNKNRANDTVPHAHPASIPDVSPRWMPWSVCPLAGTTVGLMAVSLPQGDAWKGHRFADRPVLPALPRPHEPMTGCAVRGRWAGRNRGGANSVSWPS
jgi:hypothetical protein